VPSAREYLQVEGGPRTGSAVPGKSIEAALIQRPACVSSASCGASDVSCSLVEDVRLAFQPLSYDLKI